MEEFFDLCAEIESTMSLVYRRMANAICGNEQLKELMLQLAKDEADHVNQVRFARLLPEKESFSGVHISQTKLERLLLKAQSLLKDIEQNPPCEKDILVQAIALEEDFIQVHVTSALEFAEPKLKERFKLLAREDERHVATLRTYFQEVYQRSA